MAVAYIKSLVQLNLGADDAAFDQSIEVKEDEGVNADESYFKYGAAALKHIFDDSTTSGALFFFWAPHHGDENAADVLHCAAPTMPPEGHNRRSVHFLKLGKINVEGNRNELMDCLQFGACTANVLSDMAGAISASRRVEAPSLHSNDSCPSDEAVGGLIFDFERISGEIVTRYISHRWPRPSARNARPTTSCANSETPRTRR